MLVVGPSTGLGAGWDDSAAGAAGAGGSGARGRGVDSRGRSGGGGASGSTNGVEVACSSVGTIVSGVLVDKISGVVVAVVSVVIACSGVGVASVEVACPVRGVKLSNGAVSSAKTGRVKLPPSQRVIENIMTINNFLVSIISN